MKLVLLRRLFVPVPLPVCHLFSTFAASGQSPPKTTLLLVHKLPGELCGAKDLHAAATSRPARPTLPARLATMGVPLSLHMVDPLDFHTGGLVLCTSSADLARFLSSTPATLARFCRASELLLGVPMGGSAPSSPPPSALDARALAAARRSVVTRTYRMRPVSPLRPHVVAELARGGARVNGWRAPPVYVEGGGGEAPAGAGSGAGAGVGAGSARPAPAPPAPTPRSQWLSVTTVLPSRPLRQLLAAKGVAPARLLRTGFGPFRLEKSLAAGSALEVAIPPRLMSAALRFARALKAHSSAATASGADSGAKQAAAT
jgi:16S rRNA U516 pseudouridylate synthase RsuA-like enzyme